MKGKPHYESSPRNNYGAVDYLEGKHTMSTAFAGLPTYKLGDEIEYQLNTAVDRGFEWARLKVKTCAATHKTNDEILECIYDEFSELGNP